MKTTAQQIADQIPQGGQCYQTMEGITLAQMCAQEAVETDCINKGMSDQMTRWTFGDGSCLIDYSQYWDVGLDPRCWCPVGPSAYHQEGCKLREPLPHEVERGLLADLHRAREDHAWYGADWCHQRRVDGVDQDDYCEGGYPGECQVCEEAESDARAANEHAEEAMRHATSAGHLYDLALKEAKEAARIECHWGDDPTYAPLVKALEALVAWQDSLGEEE